MSMAALCGRYLRGNWGTESRSPILRPRLCSTEVREVLWSWATQVRILLLAASTTCGQPSTPQLLPVYTSTVLVPILQDCSEDSVKIHIFLGEAAQEEAPRQKHLGHWLRHYCFSICKMDKSHLSPYFQDPGDEPSPYKLTNSIK